VGRWIGINLGFSEQINFRLYTDILSTNKKKKKKSIYVCISCL